MIGNGVLHYWLGIGPSFFFPFLSLLTSTSIRLHCCIGKLYHWFIFTRMPESLPRMNVNKGS
jgi:hypothetical protein